MDKKAILNHIIENNGSCSWLIPFYEDPSSNDLPCVICPLNRLSKRADGSYLGCVSSLLRTLDDVKNCDAIYLGAAQEALTNILVDEMLDEEPSKAKSDSNKDRTT